MKQKRKYHILATMAKQRRKFRIFIVAPTEVGAGWGDVAHQVCKTYSRKTLDFIYNADLYDVEDQFDNLPDAIKSAKRRGSKRPTVI